MKFLKRLFKKGQKVEGRLEGLTFEEKKNEVIKNKLIELTKKLDDYKMPDNLLQGDTVFILQKYRRINYKVFWNVNIKVKDLEKAKKIDCILVTPYKIFVIECKDFKECLGIKEIDYEKEKWVYLYKGLEKKSSNLVIQNEQHIRELSNYLKLDKELFKSLVIFIGGNDFYGNIEDDRVIFLKNKDRYNLRNLLTNKIKESSVSKILTNEQILDISMIFLKSMNLEKKNNKKR